MSPFGVVPLEQLPGPRLTRARLPGLELVTHLLETAEQHPEPLVVHAVESFFAPHMGTVGCVGVRGRTAIRAVLSNSDDYRPLQPDTADLPEDVQSLSRGVFTFDGPSHVRQRSALRELITLEPPAVEVIAAAVRRALGAWPGRELDLTGACRDVARDVLGAVLFGPGERGAAIAQDVRQVVDARRAGRLAASPQEHRAARSRLVVASRRAATRIGEWLDGGDRLGLLAGLGRDLAGDGARAQAIAHATAVCAAATEPTAATLGWATLALTQRPDIQDAIRTSDGLAADAATARSAMGSPDLLDRVILETQRLLPSSAIVTRATRRPVDVAGHVLPAGCEVMVSSLLAHREPEPFPEPIRFAPERWVGLEVSPFEFFPFGAGTRGCLGASVARAVLRMTLAEIARGTVALAFTTKVGWQMPDALIPSSGVPIRLEKGRAGSPPGRAEGAITRIVDFDSSALDVPYLRG